MGRKNSIDLELISSNEVFVFVNWNISDNIDCSP